MAVVYHQKNYITSWHKFLLLNRSMQGGVDERKVLKVNICCRATSLQASLDPEFCLFGHMIEFFRQYCDFKQNTNSRLITLSLINNAGLKYSLLCACFLEGALFDVLFCLSSRCDMNWNMSSNLLYWLIKLIRSQRRLHANVWPARNPKEMVFLETRHGKEFLRRNPWMKVSATSTIHLVGVCKGG